MPWSCDGAFKKGSGAWGVIIQPILWMRCCCLLEGLARGYEIKYRKEEFLVDTRSNGGCSRAQQTLQVNWYMPVVDMVDRKYLPGAEGRNLLAAPRVRWSSPPLFSFFFRFVANRGRCSRRWEDKGVLRRLSRRLFELTTFEGSIDCFVACCSILGSSWRYHEVCGSSRRSRQLLSSNIMRIMSWSCLL